MIRSVCFTTVVGLVAVQAPRAIAQTYDISWSTSDGGGQMWSTGGGYELGATIGQPDAGAPMSGGGWTLTGGFWPSGAAAGPTILPGDLNCDGSVGFDDINPFVLYLSNFATWQATYTGCPPQNGDINGDGTYGQSSFGDINPFVALLTGGG